MSKTIFKYPIHDAERFVEIPKGAQILSLQTQKGLATIWAMVEEEKEKVRRRIYVFGTGRLIPDNVKPEWYIGTVQDSYGFVWHFFLEAE